MDAFTNGLVLSALICFWIGEAVRDFTENKWSPLFFMDALGIGAERAYKLVIKEFEIDLA